MFLPDRYIKGECPKCGAKDQYGDSCEVCGAVYAPTELKNPYSTLTGATPVMKSSEHYFVKLSDPRCVAFLEDWTAQVGLQAEVLNKIKEWFAKDDEGHGGLGDWDISRDAPYFGIEIPDAPGKYFYVWLDAPIGYLASLKHYCDRTGRDFDALMADPATEQSTSSARTSPTSTRCSGPRCCISAAARRRPTCSCTASSRSRKRR